MCSTRVDSENLHLCRQFDTNIKVITMTKYQRWSFFQSKPLYGANWFPSLYPAIKICQVILNVYIYAYMNGNDRIQFRKCKNNTRKNSPFLKKLPFKLTKTIMRCHGLLSKLSRSWCLSWELTEYNVLFSRQVCPIFVFSSLVSFVYTKYFV